MTDNTPARLHNAASPDHAVHILEQTFPGVEIWHGHHSRHYQAIHHGHLLTAPTAVGLYQQLRERRTQ